MRGTEIDVEQWKGLGQRYKESDGERERKNGKKEDFIFSLKLCIQEGRLILLTYVLHEGILYCSQWQRDYMNNWWGEERWERTRQEGQIQMFNMAPQKGFSAIYNKYIIWI